MTPERWKKVRGIFEQALELEGDARESFVAAATESDPPLAAEVRYLLASEKAAANFLEVPAAAAAVRLSEETDPPGTRRVGPYVLHEKIGQGGMGRVYRAARSDEAYHRQVALKIVNRGMNTEFILRRFRNERQILAGLDHVNIARLHDGGTTEDGLPYFAMEYIEGKDLLAWCDTHRLSITARLNLFLDVCGAVAYAHRNLVVHRDLKPGNIFVTAEGVPKLLDFGLAKILNAEVSAGAAEVTGVEARLLTPEYASPEQVRGEKITTSSDIYSLGVILYELLTGRRPYRLKTREPGEIARAVCDEEPERPSTAVTRVEDPALGDGDGRPLPTPESVSARREGDPARLQKRLTGDLDNIVLMCLRKEPERRYGSVEFLAEDIRRHLGGRPVHARGSTFTYRAGKFVRRNRVLVAAGSLVAASLVVSLGISLRQTRVARAERARAEHRFQQVRNLAHTFLFDVHDAVAELPGSTKARGILVKEGLAYLDSLAQEAGDDRKLKSELASAYMRVADVQSGVGAANEGDSVSALASFKKAVAIREEVLARDPSDLMAEARLGGTQQRLAWAISASGEPAEARSLLEKSVVHLEKAARAPGAAAWVRHALAYAYGDLAETWERTQDYGRALESHEKARLVTEGILATDPLNTRARLRLVFTIGDIGFCQMKLGEMAPALAAFERALPLAETLAAEDARNAQAKSALGMVKLFLGEAFVKTGRPPQALGQLGASATIFEAMIAGDPLNAWARSQLGRVYLATGNGWSASAARSRRSDEADRACSFFRRSVETLSSLQSEGRLPGIERPLLQEAEKARQACDSARTRKEG